MGERANWLIKATDLAEKVRVFEGQLTLEYGFKVKLSIASYPDKEIDLDDIVRAVAKICEVREEEILGRSRVREVVDARHLCLYIARQFVPAITLHQIGLPFALDHATVINGIRKIKDLIEIKNEDICRKYDEIRKNLFTNLTTI